MADPDVILGWMRDRLDDEEEAALGCAPGPWGIDGPPRESRIYSRPTGVTVATGWLRDLRHAARYDPARALREVTAKRRRLERHQPWGGNGSPARCSTCGAHGESDLWPCDEVIDDAQSWADRGDMPAELRIT